MKQVLAGDVGEAKLGSNEIGCRNGKPTGDYNETIRGIRKRYWGGMTELGEALRLLGLGARRFGGDGAQEISLPPDADAKSARGSAECGHQNHDRARGELYGAVG